MSNFTGSLAEKQLVRQVIDVTLPVACRDISIVLSNRYGTRQLRIEHAWIERVSGAVKPVLFDGVASVAISPGQSVESAPIASRLSAGRLRICLEPAEGQTAITLGSGMDRTMFEVVSSDGENQFYWGLESIWGKSDRNTSPVCFFGDSFTNQGRYTGPASKLLMCSGIDAIPYNCGISGNRLLHDAAGDSLWTPSFGPAAVTRFKCDVTFDGSVTR